MSTEIAVFAGGCFWCTEAIFQQLRGVKSITPGYAGGTTVNPNYYNHGDHAEAIKIEFDPDVISYNDLLTVFFATHDPTTMNRQGADVGSQYRSMVLVMHDDQRTAAEQMIEQLNKELGPSHPVVTEIQDAAEFYPAESFHLNYYQNNRESGYCRLVINPKLSKLRSKFSSLLQENRS